ncbi:alpha/beta fold hydrolase [Alcanivorax sp. IO_7]|nr:alpha/beta fold hydrolase [Alcanivorax sp. IO_7]
MRPQPRRRSGPPGNRKPPRLAGGGPATGHARHGPPLAAGPDPGSPACRRATGRGHPHHDRRAFPDQLEAHIAAGATRPDSRAVLRAIATPTLLLAGAEDRLRPPAAHREMAALIPDVRLVEIPGAGHMLTMENPEAVNAALEEWVAATRPLCSRGRRLPRPARQCRLKTRGHDDDRSHYR